jgi:AcrR family transcriptional regulator
VNKAEPAAESGRARSFGLAIKQERGKVTYDALIEAGFRLLARHELQDISIADLASEAGYSVGAFYARFRSKDEFFDALIDRHLEIRTDTQIQLFATLPLESLPEQLLQNVVGYYWENQNFWRAVLARGLRDPAFWESICNHGIEFASRFIDRLTQEIGRSLESREIAHIFFSFQSTLSTINLTILALHCPEIDDNRAFTSDLTRAFRLTSDFDRLVCFKQQNQLTEV